MDDKTREVMRDVLRTFGDLSYIKPEDVPDIPLYMDQITTFMDSKLENCKRYPEDKTLTKTMINNYTKNRLIPPPEKKKYSKDHLLLMIFVYYLKDFLSISDIQTILTPIEEAYFQKGEGMQPVYEAAFDLLYGEKENMMRDLVQRFKLAEKSFKAEGIEDDEYLHIFAFVCLLSFDVYVRKRLIEAVVDSLNKKES